MDEYAVLLIRAILAVIAMLLTKYVIPLLKEWYEAKVDEKIKKVIKDSVEAFEQTIKGSGKGPVKKEEVVKYATEALLKAGISVDEKKMDILIESAVFVMNKQTMSNLE